MKNRFNGPQIHLTLSAAVYRHCPAAVSNNRPLHHRHPYLKIFYTLLQHTTFLTLFQCIIIFHFQHISALLCLRI